MANHLIPCGFGKLVTRMTLKAVSWTLKDDFLYLFESLRSGQMSPQLCIPNPSGTVKQIGRKERHPPSSMQNLEKN